MKKLTLLFALPALAGILMGCGGRGGHSGDTSSSATSQSSQTTSSEASESIVTSESSHSEITPSSSEQSSEESISYSYPEEEKKQTYNFYIDYSHSDEPFFTMKWWNGHPLGEIPAECRLTSADAPDEAYPVFLGWSKYSSTIDESQLWDFTKDASMNKTVSLYGVWVSE